ncbi:DUF6297 family protein [Nonomuraea sp. NPDC050643]|uniref:DUF6297 family protein n=1 Tax=Nonomuraea sp. NPDC050643 TaxID=3155660 RepID=UPI0033C76185
MTGVRTVRAYLRSHGRAPSSLLDRYVAVFALLLLTAVVGHPLTSMLAGLAEQARPAHMGAGVALLALALAGFLGAARAAGPVLLPAPDAFWLLLSPLDRRGLLGRTGRVLLLVAGAAGVLLGIGLLAVLGAPDQLVWRVLGALVLGVSATVGGMALAVLGQSAPSWQFWLTAAMTVLLVLAVVAVSGRLRTVLATAAAAPLPAVAAAAAGVALASGLLVRRAWASLDRIPARTLLSASTRAGHVATAAVSLDPGALTWIAEDNHWRARRLTSRRWPSSLPAPVALAWHDWRRLTRRPGRLVAVTATAALPSVLAQAGGSPALAGMTVLAGGMAVAAMHTSGARRDSDNPALARLIGIGLRPALAARALLPALMSGVWTTAALAALSGAGGEAWWMFGPLVAPALAAGALRMARRSPVDHSLPVIDTPGGAIPTGPLLWAARGVDLALLGCLPAAVALTAPPAAPASYLVAQGVWGVAVLAAYVLRARAA